MTARLPPKIRDANTGHKAKPRSAERGKRYSTEAELRAAVHAYCVDQVNAEAGIPDWWDATKEAQLRRHFERGPDVLKEDKAKRIREQLCGALRDAAELTRDLPPYPRRGSQLGVWGYGTRRLAELAPLLAGLLAELDLNEHLWSHVMPDRPVREWIADPAGHHVHWWPVRTVDFSDLAIMSVLAGNYPDVRGILKKGQGLTVAKVLRCEAQGIRDARGRLV